MIDSFEGEFFFLSNFFEKPAPSNEHYFQAAKATNEKDREYVMSAPTPGAAKHRGRWDIKCRPDWEEIKIKVMKDLCRVKFSDLELRKLLLEKTGDQELVEGNWWNDDYWGVCKKKGTGQNHLGKILMEIRAEIKEEMKGGRA
jgi:ribA/ribD-fused uncharacterized protein